DFFRIRSSTYGVKNHEAVDQERTERYIRKQRESSDSCGIELNDCDRDNGKCSSEPSQNPFLLKNPLILGGHISPPTSDKRCGREGTEVSSSLTLASSRSRGSFQIAAVTHDQEGGLESVIDLQFVKDIGKVRFY